MSDTNATISIYLCLACLCCLKHHSITIWWQWSGFFCCCLVLQTLMFGQSPALYFLKPENPEGEQAYVRVFLSPLMGETKAACCSFKGWFIGENLLEMPFLCTFFSYLTIFRGTDSMWNILITYSGIIIDILTKFTADAITLSFLPCSAHWGKHTLRVFEIITEC